VQLREISEAELSTTLSAHAIRLSLGEILGEVVDLSYADLSGHDLSGAELFDATCRQSDFTGTNLKGAQLQFVNMSETKLIGTNISGACMYCADLRYANLDSLLGWLVVDNWKVANLWGAVNAPQRFMDWAVEQKGAVCIEEEERWHDAIRNEWMGRPYDQS
jgi:uncharacterized protein YjbI with pentapeptide repeats